MGVLMAGKDPIAQLSAEQEDMEKIALDIAAQIATKAVIMLPENVQVVAKKDFKDMHAVNALSKDLGPIVRYADTVGITLYGATMVGMVADVGRSAESARTHLVIQLQERAEVDARADMSEIIVTLVILYLDVTRHYVLFPACPAGRFGPDCSQSCRGHCKNDLPCNHVTGECHNGCAGGWQGSDCSTAYCPPGSYGFNCSQRCSENCKSSALCDHVT
ncbi:hypothetical protein B566_EDAN015818, partial [Ephemera danica]